MKRISMLFLILCLCLVSVASSQQAPGNAGSRWQRVPQARHGALGPV